MSPISLGLRDPGWRLYPIARPAGTGAADTWQFHATPEPGAAGFRSRSRFREAILFHLGKLELYPMFSICCLLEMVKRVLSFCEYRLGIPAFA